MGFGKGRFPVLSRCRGCGLNTIVIWDTYVTRGVLEWPQSIGLTV